MPRLLKEITFSLPPVIPTFFLLSFLFHVSFFVNPFLEQQRFVASNETNINFHTLYYFNNITTSSNREIIIIASTTRRNIFSSIPWYLFVRTHILSFTSFHTFLTYKFLFNYTLDYIFPKFHWYFKFQNIGGEYWII